jgi:hypothetical protein
LGRKSGCLCCCSGALCQRLVLLDEEGCDAVAVDAGSQDGDDVPGITGAEGEQPRRSPMGVIDSARRGGDMGDR